MFRKTAGFRDSVRRFARARVAERSPQSSGQPLQIFQGARNVRQRALQPPDMIFTELGLPLRVRQVLAHFLETVIGGQSCCDDRRGRARRGVVAVQCGVCLMMGRVCRRSRIVIADGWMHRMMDVKKVVTPRLRVIAW